MGGKSQSQSPPRRTFVLFSIVVLLTSSVWPPAAPAQRARRGEQARPGEQGALVAQRNLGELVDAAGVIVVGTVLYARVQPHPDFKNIPTVLVAVQVEETLKGEAGGVYVYRQAVLDIREQYNTSGYKKGQQVLLLLASPSRLGLSSPMGLGLGRFRIEAGPQGQKFAVNSYANAGLFEGMRRELRMRGIDPTAAEDALLEQERGAVRLEDLTGLIRKLVEKP